MRRSSERLFQIWNYRRDAGGLMATPMMQQFGY